MNFGKRTDEKPAVYRGGTATISIEGLKAGTAVEVVDEDRSITAEDGKFADVFEPLGVQIYRFKM